MELTESFFVEADAGRFHVRTTGNDGVPVVMLHGWPESGLCWKPVVDNLQGNFRVIAPDLRGLGDSVRTLDMADYRKQALAQDMIAVLDAMGVKEFYLVGHDWGGAVAQEIALLIPERVKRLCLLNIQILTNPRGTRDAVNKANSRGNVFAWYQHFQQQRGLAEAMIPGNETTWLGHFLRTWSGDPFPADAFAEYVRCYRITDTPTTGANYYRAMREDIKHWATLIDRTISAPTLYILGTKDPVIIPEFVNHAEEGFDYLEIQEIEAGHFVQEEQPQAVAQYIDTFLSEVGKS